jgi:hypothetical protein
MGKEPENSSWFMITKTDRWNCITEEQKNIYKVATKKRKTYAKVFENKQHNKSGNKWLK